MEQTFLRTGQAHDFDSAPARLTIDLGAITGNWLEMARLSAPARAAAVVKADAYGLGAVRVGQVLAAAGCRDFFVATPEEGAILRAALPDARIFVLFGLWRGVERIFFDNNLIPVLASADQLEVLISSGRDHPYALQIDTGMSRLGMTLDEARALAASGTRPPMHLLSHLACPDDPAQTMSRRQLESFQQVRQIFSGVESSLSSSEGTLLGGDYLCEIIRPGIALYGGLIPSHLAGRLRPVVKAEARVLQVRNVKKGDSASYGATHIFKADSRVAIVGAGYADGWLRTASGSGVPARENGSRGAVGFVAGQRVPVVGRITMDLTTFDIGALDKDAVRPGDYIELFGENLPLDEMARAAGTIGYEVLTSLGSRYARRYI